MTQHAAKPGSVESWARRNGWDLLAALGVIMAVLAVLAICLAIVNNASL